MSRREVNLNPNLFAGSPLNRLSWLRPSHTFLNTIASDHPRTKWVVYNSGKILVENAKDPIDDKIVEPNESISADKGAHKKKSGLAYLTTSEIAPFVGSAPFFGQGERPGTIQEDQIFDNEGKPHHFVEAARLRGLPLVFLGLDESSYRGRDEDDDNDKFGRTARQPILLKDFKNVQTLRALLEGSSLEEMIRGTPYFGLDLTESEMSEDNGKNALKEILSGRVVARNEEVKTELTWRESRTVLVSGLDRKEAAILGEGLSMVDWNRRNKFCPACGSRCHSLWGGWKIACSSLLPWAQNGNRKPCPTGRGLHNFMHPRTDACVIMVAISEKGDKILLGKNKKFPMKAYSALAGFIEPGESFEDAVKREMMEEAGVEVWNITYHSGQPWPYPANLMVGFYATADSSEQPRTDLDNELDDVQWFDRETIQGVMNHPDGDNIMGRGERARPPIQGLDEPPFRIPPRAAIAGVLIRDWVEGKIGPGPIEGTRKGNL